MNHYLFGKGWINVMIPHLFGGSLNFRYDALFILRDLDLRYDSLFIWRGTRFT